MEEIEVWKFLGFFVDFVLQKVLHLVVLPIMVPSSLDRFACMSLRLIQNIYSMFEFEHITFEARKGLPSSSTLSSRERMKAFFEIYSYLTARPKALWKFGKRGRRPERRRTRKVPLAKPPERGVVDASRRVTPMGHYRTICMFGRAWGCAGWLAAVAISPVDMAGTALTVLLRITTTVGCSFMCDTGITFTDLLRLRFCPFSVYIARNIKWVRSI